MVPNHLLDAVFKQEHFVQENGDRDRYFLKSAWKVKHAVREMMDMRDEIGPVPRGIVEVDEKYVGGVPRKQRGVVNKRGKGTKKQPVLVMV